MFILKSTHEVLLKAKDAEIATLKDEVAFLRNFIQPSVTKSVVVTHEANAVLDNNEQANEDIAREANILLTGNF